MRSPSSAPPVKGLVGSTATTATRSPACRYVVTRRSTRVDFPAPGGPVIPTRRARPRSGWTSASRRSKPARPFSTTEIARARAAVLPVRSPARRRSGSMTEKSPEGGVEARRTASRCTSGEPRASPSLLLVDMELFLRGPVDDEHQQGTDQDRPQQPALHPPYASQQHRRAAAHGIAEPRKDQ